MFELVTPKQAALQRLNECSNEASEKYLPAVRTVYRVEERTGRPEAFGTCFLLEESGQKYIVTAAHVLDDSRTSQLYIGGANALVPLMGEFHATEAPSGNRAADRYDFAYQALASENVTALGNISYVDARQVSENRGTMNGRMFMAMGYPASRNKLSLPDAKSQHIRAKAWTYCGTVYTDGVAASQVGVSDETHLLLKHSHRTSRTFSGQLTHSVKPRGASGGVLIDLGLPHPSTLAPDAKCTARLAGLLIEKHNGCNAIVAVKIGLVLQSIRGRATAQAD